MNAHKDAATETHTLLVEMQIGTAARKMFSSLLQS